MLKNMSFAEIEAKIETMNKEIETLKKENEELKNVPKMPQTGVNLTKRDFGKLETILKKTNEFRNILIENGILEIEEELKKTTLGIPTESLANNLEGLVTAMGGEKDVTNEQEPAEEPAEESIQEPIEETIDIEIETKDNLTDDEIMLQLLDE